MSNTLQEGRAFDVRQNTPGIVHYTPIEEVDYFGTPNSTTPVFDSTWASYVDQHPELASVNFDTAQPTTDLYTPIEDNSAQDLGQWMADRQSFPRMQELLGDETLLTNKDIIDEGLGLQIPNAVAATREQTVQTEPDADTEPAKSTDSIDTLELGRHTFTRQRRSLGAGAIGTSIGTEEPETRGFIKRFLSKREKSPEEIAMKEAKKTRRRQIRAIGAVAAGAMLLVGVVGHGAVKKMSDPSFHEGPAVVRTTDTYNQTGIEPAQTGKGAETTPQPTVETVKPQEKMTPKRAQKDENDKIIYAEIDEQGEGIWGAAADSLPKRLRTDDRINDIKNGVLRVHHLSEAEASQLHQGFEFSYNLRDVA